MKNFGLIGFPLAHSFSKKYFSEKFEKEQSDAQYELYELPTITCFPDLLAQIEFSGLNVTIPYKEQIIPYLDELDDTAAKVGAVNVIKFIRQGGKTTLRGYNSDAIGFIESIRPYIANRQKALILGTGGAAKAVRYGLELLGITCTNVSRKAPQLTYAQLTPEMIAGYEIIVNATPVGTFPNVETCPDIPYSGISNKHLLYDVVYNPEKTLFLQHGENQQATIVNGLEMLHLQAKAAWQIWNQQ